MARASASSSLTLARNGRSPYSIAISPEASLSEQRGASELQRFMEEISGARLPITSDAGRTQNHLVLVGNSPALQRLRLNIDFDRLGGEGFILKTVGNHLVIAGGRQRGTMYGVYAFLEKLGCRWFTANVSHIPKMRAIRVEPLDETQKPAFEYREPFFEEALDKDWAARNRMNGAHAKLDASTGGRVEYYPFVHTFAELIPPEKYFKDHPEYFSLVDGARRAENAQLCLTNQDVLRLGIETVMGWIREHPEATIYSVSQNDCTGWCECVNCQRVEKEEGGAHSGPLLRYVNAVAAAVEKNHPEKLIDTLAYWYTEDPPANVRPRANVRIRLCPIGACDAHPFEACPYDAYFFKHLQAWSKITNQLYIWHYNTNFSDYLLPLPDFDELAADIPMYRRHGVVGVFLEGSPSPGGGAENAELRSYVMARLLWDTETDVRQAIDEFHTANYGEAARPMRAYFDLLHRQVRLPPQGHGNHAWIYDRADAPYLDGEFLAEATKLFGQAETAARNETAHRNVRKARLSIDYIQLTRAKVFTVQDGWYQPAALAGLKETWNRFVAAVRSFGITELREHTPLSQDEQEFAARMRPYRVITLENELLRVDVVPELDARVVRMIDKRGGRDLLLRPNPGGRQYPDLGGLTIAAHSDYVSAPAWRVAWEPDEHASIEARFKGKSENGLELDRILRIDGALLRTTTILKNASPAPVEALLRSQCEADPGDLNHVVVSYKNQSSSSIERALIQPAVEPSGGEVYSDLKQPDGEWRVARRSGETIIVNRFPKKQVARCILNWSAKNENRVSLAVVSTRKTLLSGESLKLESDYGVE